jgi:CHASE3 domain sensor protein
LCFCAFVLLCFCAFVLLCFCAFVLLCFCAFVLLAQAERRLERKTQQAQELRRTLSLKPDGN